MKSSVIYRFKHQLIALMLISYLPISSVLANTSDKQLNRIADIYTQELLETTQVYAYFINLPLERHDKLADNTPQASKKFAEMESKLLSELNTIDTKTLSSQKARIFHAKIVEALEADIEKTICKTELWNVNHMQSPANILSTLIGIQPVDSEQNKQDAIARWRDAARYYRQEIENLKVGIEQGYSAPKRVVIRVVEQLQQLNHIAPGNHPFMKLAKRANDKAFEQKFENLLQQQLIPAMKAYQEYLENEYLDKARTQLGIHVLPNGRACYMAQYRAHTTLKRTPEQVFELGLKTVNDNKDKFRKLGKQFYKTDTFSDAVKMANLDEKEKFATAQAMHDFFEEVVKRSKAVSTQYFKKLPKVQMLVEAIPDYQQGLGQSAHYVPGSDDRFAKFAYDPTNYSNENYGTAEIVTVHEGYPGHHLQIALVQEQVNFHPIESAFSNTAFIEGWARYAETLSEEAGIYQSDSAKILRRSWPARGMVVDTGLHILGWTNQQAIDFIKESGNPALSNDADAMLDRIATLPGQLTAYDSGALEIMALRKQYKNAMGDDYDIKEFHRLILENGDAPLLVLKQQVLRTIK